METMENPRQNDDHSSRHTNGANWCRAPSEVLTVALYKSSFAELLAAQWFRVRNRTNSAFFNIKFSIFYNVDLTINDI